MSEVTRRKLIMTGLAAAAGASGIVAAAKLAQHHGLIPPDAGVRYGAGEALTYAAQRVIGSHALAREFSPSQISEKPFANEVDPLGDEFKRLQDGGFADWHLTVDGMASRPTTFSYAEIKSFSTSSQITMIGCEEGWTYIAEWSGVPLSYILDRVGALPQVRYVVYRSFQKGWWESIDMADALHPQTLVATGMNGTDLPVPFGGPLRLRVPRQLGYKNIKYLKQLTLTDNPKLFGKGGTGGSSSDAGYAWYAGI
jgi:DMSO/TMAO reductase YedYZ molybdopterin-dependent catalytic subunit